MSKGKYLKVSGMNEKSLVRSSAAEYLTFVAASGTGGVEAVYADENIWLTQKMMGVLYDVETHTINYHLKKIFADSELQENAVIRNFRITAADGKSYNTKHYSQEPLAFLRRPAPRQGAGVQPALRRGRRWLPLLRHFESRMRQKTPIGDK
ncbi:hypothetical protein [Desulfonatronum parangueonense]